MEIAQCINNNITTIVAHPTPGTSKESVTQPDYLVVAKLKHDTKTKQNWNRPRKTRRTVVISLKNPRPPQPLP
jgi:hypothetical protein